MIAQEREKEMKTDKWSIGDRCETPKGIGQIAEFASKIGYSAEHLQPHFKVMLDDGIVVWVPINQCKRVSQ
jgi:hypothetical protein